MYSELIVLRRSHFLKDFLQNNAVPGLEKACETSYLKIMSVFAVILKVSAKALLPDGI